MSTESSLKRNKEFWCFKNCFLFIIQALKVLFFIFFHIAENFKQHIKYDNDEVFINYHYYLEIFNFITI